MSNASKKWIVIIAIVLLIPLGIYLYQDARTLDIDKSDLPVDENLAVTIAQRYLAGGWTHPVRLDLTPYEMKNVEETSLTFIVYIIDERDTSSCTGYQVVVEKSSGEVVDKEHMNYCQ